MAETAYEIEIGVARAAIGCPRRAAEAWRSGCFNGEQTLTTEIAPAILAACLVWDDRLHAWSEVGPLMRLARIALAGNDAWFDDELSTMPGDDVGWLSPVWGMTHLRAGTAVMSDPTAGAFAWDAAFSKWQQEQQRRELAA